MPGIALDRRDLVLNIKLPHTSARIRMPLLPAAAAALLTLAMALLTIGLAWGAPPATGAPAAPSAPPATPALPTGAAAGAQAAAAAATLTAADLDAWLDGYLPYALKTGDIAGAEV